MSKFQMQNNRDNVEAALLEMLPHGSGIDCNWSFEWRINGSVRCSNSFHCMNDAGYYVGYADFSIVIPAFKSLQAFALQFHGKQAQRLNKKYMLRDFLEDTLCECLPDDKSLLSLSIERIK